MSRAIFIDLRLAAFGFKLGLYLGQQLFVRFVKRSSFEHVRTAQQGAPERLFSAPFF